MFLLTNLIIGFLFLSSIINFNSLVLGLILCLVIFILPGMVWAGACGGQKDKTQFELLFHWLMLSTLVLIIGMAIHVVANIKIGARSFAYYLFFVNNSALIIAYFRNRKSENTDFKFFPTKVSLKIVIMVILALFSSLLIFYYLAVYVVPPLQDNTLTTQATAYGLSRYFIPRTFTDRYISYEFAHPLLMHFYTAGSIFLSGNLDNLRYYYDYAQSAEELLSRPPQIGDEISLLIQKFGRVKVRIDKTVEGRIFLDKQIPQIRPNGRLTPLMASQFIGDNQIREDYIPVSGHQLVNNIDYDIIKEGKYWRMAREVYAKFYQHPHLFPSRVANIFFSLLCCLAIYNILIATTQSRYISAIGVLCYISMPELLVRSIAGSYTSVTIFSMLVITYFYLKQKHKAVFLSALFAALVNHKAAIILLPIGLIELYERGIFKRGNLFYFAIFGFTIGTVLFWSYGIIVDKQAFLLDHFRYHLFNRVFHVSELGYQGYPSISELWAEFTQNINPFLIFPALLSMIAIIICNRKKSWIIFPIWFILGGVAFSVIDWRSTKHLQLIVPALVISLMIVISRSVKLKKAWLTFVFLGIIVNLAKLLYFISSKNLFIIADHW
ncbi:hypothetical protein ACFL2I_00010 [Candidatus Omnitrophota bacterium]